MSTSSRPRGGRLTLVFLGVIAAGLVVGGLAPSAGSEDGGPMVGASAPEISMETFDGEEWLLSRHLAQEGGGTTVVNLWASWCLPCREEIPELARFSADNPEVSVVGVAVDDTWEDAARLAAELDPPYPVGLDTTGRLEERYSVFGLPATFVIDERGVVRQHLERPVTQADLEALIR